MYNDEKGRRTMALSITHYVYRNTRLEDFHAECVQMDRNFYRIIYNTVRTKLKNVIELQLKFIRYLQDIMFGLFFGTNWDPPFKPKKYARTRVMQTM